MYRLVALFAVGMLMLLSVTAMADPGIQITGQVDVSSDAYLMDKNGKVELSKQLEWRIRSDEGRVVVALADVKNGSEPIVVYMDRASAQQLLKELAGARRLHGQGRKIEGTEAAIYRGQYGSKKSKDSLPKGTQLIIRRGYAGFNRQTGNYREDCVLAALQDGNFWLLVCKMDDVIAQKLGKNLARVIGR